MNNTPNQEKTQSLQFDQNRHCIVNVISTLTNSQLIQLINDFSSDDIPTPASRGMKLTQIIKAVPLPGVQFLSGN